MLSSFYIRTIQVQAQIGVCLNSTIVSFSIIIRFKIQYLYNYKSKIKTKLLISCPNEGTLHHADAFKESWLPAPTIFIYLKESN